MLHLNTIVCIDDTRSENKARSRLVDAHLAPISDFLNQLQQVDLVGQQARVAVIGADILDDDLAT